MIYLIKPLDPTLGTCFTNNPCIHRFHLQWESTPKV